MPTTTTTCSTTRSRRPSAPTPASAASTRTASRTGTSTGRPRTSTRSRSSRANTRASGPTRTRSTRPTPRSTSTATLNYSDGKQGTTLPDTATYQPLIDCVARYPWALDFDHDDVTEASEAGYLDRDRDGKLTDDEMDGDGDCLSNWDESHGRMLRSYWDTVYSRETAFPTPMAEVDLFDADSDGDGIPDGVDDQDHDGLVNIAELSRMAVSHRTRDAADLDPGLGNPNPPAGRVNPYNPCLPFTNSQTCPRYIPIEKPWAPYDGPPYLIKRNDPNYLVLQ